MKFCHQCRNHLVLGTEIYCPACGAKQIIASESGSNSVSTATMYTGISGISGDVIGSTTSGIGNIIGKEVTYSVSGNVIHLHVESISAQELKDILSRPVQLETKADLGQQPRNIIAELDDTKANEAKVTKEVAEQVLKDIDQIGGEKGVHIEQIRVEELQVSRSQLQLKDITFEGNEYHYKGDYWKAIQCYDRALEIDENNGDIWHNKGLALHDLGKYYEAIQCHDRALEIDEKSVDVWNSKGSALYCLGMYNEAIQCYDKTLEIDEKYAYAWNNKGLGFWSSRQV